MVSRVAATDQRNEAPNYLATIRGGYGNPLKVRYTIDPIEDEVAKVFTDALDAHGMFDRSGRGPYEIALNIRQFDADELLRNEANVDVDMTVLNRFTRSVIYKDRIRGNEEHLKLLTSGIFASMDDLQALAERVLDRGINRTIEKPDFIQAISAPGADS